MQNTAVSAAFEGGGEKRVTKSKQANWVSHSKRLAVLPEKRETVTQSHCLLVVVWISVCGLLHKYNHRRFFFLLKNPFYCLLFLLCRK